MSDNQKLNTLIIRYQSGERALFSEIYAALTPIRTRHINGASGRYLDDRHTRQGTFDDRLMSVIDRWRPDDNDFIGYFSAALRNATAKCVRKQKTAMLSAEIFDSPPDDNEEESDISRYANIADDRINVEELVQKKTDHRQVIRFLLSSPAEYDLAYNRLDYDTDNALAKALGIHHTAVKRKWNKIAARYDANRFGPLSSLLA